VLGRQRQLDQRRHRTLDAQQRVSHLEQRVRPRKQTSAALDTFAEFSEKWERKYPAIIRLWTNAWAEFVPVLQFDQEIRTIICTTNAIESINARIRRAVNARGHFPTEAAALKCVYLAIMSLDLTGRGQRRWSNRWKAALNAFEITFDGRLSAARDAS
jgi:putative transposase